MSGRRAKALRKEARCRGMDGSVVIANEYKRLKKLYVNPHYAPDIIRDSPPRKKGKKMRRVS